MFTLGLGAAFVLSVGADPGLLPWWTRTLLLPALIRLGPLMVSVFPGD